MSATPFYLRLPKESEAGLTTSRSKRFDMSGIARFDGIRLILEWSVRTLISEVGMTTSRRYEEPVQTGTCVIPLKDISSVELQGLWWRPNLEIVANSVVNVADVPSSRGARVVLWLSRHDRARAQELCSELRLALAEAALQSAHDLTELSIPGVLRLRDKS
jgi:hypothetical protein